MNGKRSLSRLPLLLFVAVVTAAIAAGIPASSAATRAAAPVGTYVGTLAGTDAFVAVLVGERGALRAYVYDATHRIAAWSQPGRAGTRLTAVAGASRVDVTSREGARLEARVARGHVSGSVRFASGEQHLFAAVQVAPPGSVYQIIVGSGVARYLGGSIMWPAGRSLGYLVAAPAVVMLARQAAG